jgi:hypothetical protein
MWIDPEVVDRYEAFVADQATFHKKHYVKTNDYAHYGAWCAYAIALSKLQELLFDEDENSGND